MPEPTQETRESIRERYLKLRVVYAGMLGSLYPQMAYRELMELRAAYVGDGEPFWGDLPPVSEPLPSGHVPGGAWSYVAP